MKRFYQLLVCNLLLAVGSGAAMTVAQHGCEQRENPLGVDVEQPCLSWILESARRGERQAAYQVIAASTSSLLNQNTGDLWDSGKVMSDDTIQIPYAGKPLQSAEQVFWKVRVWDANDKVSDWSPEATWTMGLLEPVAWKAHCFLQNTSPRFTNKPLEPLMPTP